MILIKLKQEYTNRDTNENFFVDTYLNLDAIECIRKMPQEDFWTIRTTSGDVMVLTEQDYNRVLNYYNNQNKINNLKNK